MSEALHKAFADANPGPGTFPTPGELSPQRFRRPYISAGHGAASPGQDPPNSAPIPSMGGISAGQFTRDYLDGGRAADSPSNKADDGQPPKPGRLFYRNQARDNARAAMAAVHDHIAQSFPDLCPMHGTAEPDHAPEPNPLPRPAGSVKTAGTAPDPAAAAKADRKRRRDLADAVLKGTVTAEDARRELGIEAPAEAVTKAAAPAAAIAQPLDAEAVAAIVEKANAPLLAKLAEQDRVLDAIANQPDPVSPYRGAAFPQPPLAPAGQVASVTKSAEQAQMTQMRGLFEDWRTNPDPALRERAWQALTNRLGIDGNHGTP